MSTQQHEKCITVIDVETTINSEDSFKANPHDRNNHIVAIGVLKVWKGMGLKSYDFMHVSEFKCAGYRSWQPYITEYLYDILPGTTMLIGQNIAFDLLYLRKYMSDKAYTSLVKGMTIWDTQVAEYILSGHNNKFESLDAMSERYGGTLKDSTIKDYWDKNVPTEDIPKDELLDYLEHDVRNTYKVFRGQITKLDNFNVSGTTMNPQNSVPRLQKVLSIAMEHRLATIEMQWNGMFFDRKAAGEHLAALEINVGTYHNETTSYMRGIYAHGLSHFKPEEDINPMSNTQVKTFLHGGTYSWKEDRPVYCDGVPVMYKSGSKKGQWKTKKETIHEEWDGLLQCEEEYLTHSVDDAHLKALLRGLNDGTVRAPSPESAKGFIGHILKLRKYNKDISTYFKAYSNVCWPHDSCIHPTYNHAATNTGRLSCTKPNLMNITREGT